MSGWVAFMRARAVPRVLLGVLARIAICGGLSYALSMLAAIDRLSAFLATRTGGVDAPTWRRPVQLKVSRA